ncbi:MAG: hypothetical protein KDA41_09395, partial [Planctomycetales bacterium]|nr:hypothetical protein [Planctomycetales bacterium]
MDITPPRIGLVIAFLTIVAVSARADDAPAPQVEAPKALQALSDPQMAVKQARAAQLPVVIYVSS